ncbi:general odorant-binding protein 72-like [Hyposmocoma kahamanoa]|uniref:general odorant-binding protein 72-like n=1 Tax=Hyposmocoma kahamanoa TaxID=1477025 RepID=UPI000E6D5BFC|nr:general odorant-binding protein 72-like [Hyposmocoma kahamanoa]
MFMKYILLIIAIVVLQNVYGLSKEQLKKTLGLMKKSCLSKSGATEDKVASIEQGAFLEEKNVMCYVMCIYKSVQVVKDDKLNLEMVIKQVDSLYPPEMRSSVKNAVNKCLNVQDKYNDVCSRVFYAAKCLYEQDPPNFVFP